MSNYDKQKPFDAVTELWVNPEPRCPCLLLLDTSTSMKGQAIEELNQGLVSFRNELMQDDLAQKRVEVGIVKFGPVEVVHNFQTVDMFEPPILNAWGNTPIGQAVEQGIDMLNERKEQYKAAGLAYYRPWLFLITDGAPTDEWHRAARRAQQQYDSHSLAFFSVGVKNANMNMLKELSPTEPLPLRGLQFRELFSWLSASLRSVSYSQVGDTVKLQSPHGWAEI